MARERFSGNTAANEKARRKNFDQASFARVRAIIEDATIGRRASARMETKRASKERRERATTFARGEDVWLDTMPGTGKVVAVESVASGRVYVKYPQMLQALGYNPDIVHRMDEPRE